MRLGTAVDNFRHPDRVVIGAKNRQVAEKIAKLYQPLKRPIVITDVRSAEMAKHASNTFLATSISFINEIANLCEVLEADALEVARILRLDKRIGPHAFLSPGLGFAGGTLGREIRALQKLGASHQVPMPLMDAVWQINAQRAQLVSRRLSAALGSLAGRQVGILGLTYKPGTSTLRRAISLDIEDRRRRDRRHRRLKKAEKGEKAEKAQKAQPSTPSIPSPSTPSQSLLLVLHQLREKMRGDWIRGVYPEERRAHHMVFLDTRNLLDPARMAEAGFRYLGIGR